MDHITITLVQTADGRLTGRTISDKFNLYQLLGPRYTLYADRNSTAAKQLRRRLEREFGSAFRVQIGRGCIRNEVETASRQEVDALGPELVATLGRQSVKSKVPRRNRGRATGK
jgi:hypothetical protein